MKVLIVCSGNTPNFDFQKHQAFIYDQVEAVKKADDTIQFDYFFVNQKGLKGYLRCLKGLKAQIVKEHYDCIHAHVATSALLANLQRIVPVVATFHGSDINLRLHRWISLLVAFLSKKVIYVSRQLHQKAVLRLNYKSYVLPCGVDFELFKPQSKVESRQKMGLVPEKKYILFSSNFDNTVKNADLAKTAVALLNDSDLELLELKNYTRQQVACLMSAVDVALMTSFMEGSPQFVKEAIACNCPVVSTKVGDVEEVLGEVEGCYLCSYVPTDVAKKIQLALIPTQSINGQERLARFDNRNIAHQLLTIYHCFGETTHPHH